MIVKSQLHFHTNKDPKDYFIKYSPFEAIDYAYQEGFKVLSFTHHKKFVFKQERQDYALEKGILLIPGVEIEIGKKHVLVLNSDKNINKIKSFNSLFNYKKQRENIFIIAPHPFYPLRNCVRKKFYEYPNLFDGIEYCPFYLKNFGTSPNIKAKEVASQYNKPLIGTGDVHYIKHLEETFTNIKIDFDITNLKKDNINLYMENIFHNLRQKNVDIQTQPFQKNELIKHHLALINNKIMKPITIPVKTIKDYKI